MSASLLAVTVEDIGAHLGGLDWGIIVAFLVGTTVVAFVAKGRQSGLRDFFLSDRNLPWIVVCASLIATEISAASVVGVPHSAYTGNLTYLQLAIGAIIARFIIGYHFVPGFYEHENYSPYQYVGRKFGLGAEKMTSSLFVLGAILGQGVRVFIIAAVLQLVAQIPMELSILITVACAALWAVIGGIRTVVWTDLAQLIVLILAVLVAIVFLVVQGDGGVSQILRRAAEMRKLQVLDFRTDLLLQATIWTGLFGATFNTLASHGADQMNAQRLFCCRGPGEARKAVLWSSLSQAIVLLLLVLGLGLFSFYGEHPERLTDTTRQILSQPGKGDWVLPIFIATALPTGLKGLLVVGLLAAGISSMSSALSALAQTTVRAFYGENKALLPNDEKSKVHWSRLFVLFWGFFLGAVALFFRAQFEFSDLITQVLKITSFTYGALIGTLLLAFHPAKRDGRGILFGAPFAVLATFGMTLHGDWTHWIVIAGVGILFICWFYILMREAEELTSISDSHEYVRRAWYILLAEIPRTIWVVCACLVVLYLHFYGEITHREYLELAWPWYLPMGVGITVVLGYLLSRPSSSMPARDAG